MGICDFRFKCYKLFDSYENISQLFLKHWIRNLNEILAQIYKFRFGKEFRLPVLCCASISRSLVGVAGGATKAAVAQHQV